MMVDWRTGVIVSVVLAMLVGCSAVQVKSKPPLVETQTEILRPLGIKNCQAELTDSSSHTRTFRLTATRLDLVKEETTTLDRKEVVRHSYNPMRKIGEYSVNYVSLGFGMITDLFLRLGGEALDGTAQSETSYFHNLILWGNWINPLTNALVPEGEEAGERTVKLSTPEIALIERTKETPNAPLAIWPVIVCLISEEQTYRQETLTDSDGILNIDLFELLRMANIRTSKEAAIEIQIAGHKQAPSITLARDVFLPAKAVEGRLPFLAQQQTPNIFASPQLSLQFDALQITKNPEDGLFRGGDQGLLKITVKNQGKGDALDVQLRLNGKMGEMLAEDVPNIPIIRAGAANHFAVPVKLPLLAQNGQAQLTAQAIEALGNDSAPLAVQVNYYQAYLPQLEISDLWFKDGQEGLARGDGNGLLENNEQFEIWVSVTNTGNGTALGTTVSLDEEDLAGTVVQGLTSLGDIPPATTKVAKLAIALPATLKRTEDKLIISGRDSREVGGFDKVVPVEYRQRQPQLTVTAEVKSESNHKTTTRIEKGKGGEIILTVENHGDYAAEQVAILVQSTADGIALPKNKALVGRVPAKGKSAAVRIPFTVQNRFAARQADLQIEISQQDFSSVTASTQVLVSEPEVCTVQVGGTPASITKPDQEPVVLITYPRGDTRLNAEKIRLAGAVLDDHRVRSIEVWVNGALHRDLPGRGITMTVDPQKKNRRFFEMEVPLVVGDNAIRVAAIDSKGQRSEEALTVHRETESRRMHVLVVGVDTYDDPAIENLNYSQADARAVYEFFRSPQSPARPEDVHLLTATPDKNGCDNSYRGIKKAISRYLVQKSTGNDDTVLLYFAGHGETIAHPTTGKAYYLLPRDAERSDLLGTAIAATELQTLWSTIPAKQHIFIADACDSANLTGTLGDTVFASSQIGQKALELPQYGHGLFTWSLLQGLKGKADGLLRTSDGRISIAELKAYLHREVPRLARQKGGDQQPATSLSKKPQTIFLTSKKTFLLSAND